MANYKKTKPKPCRQCGCSGEISKKGLCARCGISNQSQNIVQIREKKGPAYEKWKSRLKGWAEAL